MNGLEFATQNSVVLIGFEVVVREASLAGHHVFDSQAVFGCGFHTLFSLLEVVGVAPKALFIRGVVFAVGY